MLEFRLTLVKGARMTAQDNDWLSVPTQEDRERLNDVWRQISGGGNYMFSPKDRMDLWLVEQRMRADRLSSDRLTRATWVLSVATVVLAVSTIALVVVTLRSGT